MHVRNYQLCPASARVMPGFQPLLFKPFGLISNRKQCILGNIQTILKPLVAISIKYKLV